MKQRIASVFAAFIFFCAPFFSGCMGADALHAGNEHAAGTLTVKGTPSSYNRGDTMFSSIRETWMSGKSCALSSARQQSKKSMP